MHVAPKADRTPRACAVSGRTDGPFIDFHTEIEPPRNELYSLFLHKLVVEEAAVKLGMVKGKEFDTLKEGYDTLKAEFDELRETVDLAQRLDEKLHPERVAA